MNRPIAWARFGVSFLVVVVVVVVVVAVVAPAAGADSASPNTESSAIGELKNTIKLVREQLTAMIDHRQQDYNALEESLKRSMEKNTELTVLRNQVRQLRKEMNSLRGAGSGNEAKNERLRIKWLASAVTELRAEIAEVLAARNASEEFAQRSRMRSELELLRGDVAQTGRGIRDLGGRLARIEASLGTIRLDIFAIKERSGQLTRICADATSQLSTVQIEMKSCKCQGQSPSSLETEENRATESNNEAIRETARNNYHHHHHHHHHHDDDEGPARHAAHRVEERLTNLERKISVVARKRGVLEKRVVYENQDESRRKIVELEKRQVIAENRVSNMSGEAEKRIAKVDESIIRLYESVEKIEEKIANDGSERKRELSKLEVNAAKKYAELSLTREELANLRRTVQALSVSASKLQERSDLQRDSIASLNSSLANMTETKRNERPGFLRSFTPMLEETTSGIAKELEHAEDDYRAMIESLPANCEDRDEGLTMLAPGGQALPLLVSCHQGWIVIGRRIDGTVDFDRKWNEYAEGFGSPMNELWLGNEAIHRLTRDNCTKLAIDLVDIYGNSWRAEYEHFRVDSDETGYRLSVSGYTGNATDAFTYQNGMSFSAKDRDMDTSTSDCAANYRGGWWFSHCQHANLNGRYSLGLAWYRSDTDQWMAVTSAVMSVRRKHECGS